jgi:hypothetical protein
MAQVSKLIFRTDILPLKEYDFSIYYVEAIDCCCVELLENIVIVF